MLKNYLILFFTIGFVGISNSKIVHTTEAKKFAEAHITPDPSYGRALTENRIGKSIYMSISRSSGGICLQVDFFRDGTAKMTSFNSEGYPTKVVSGTWTSYDGEAYGEYAVTLTFKSKEGYRTSFKGDKTASGRPSNIKDGRGRTWKSWGCN